MKAIKAKPIFYTVCYEALKTICKEYGYNLLIDGSLNRDLDLVLIPWVDGYEDVYTVLLAMNTYLGGKFLTEPNGDIYSELSEGGGRYKSVINLNRESRFNRFEDVEWYLDITIIKGNGQGNKKFRATTRGFNQKQ